jgi:hypothetical protein
MANYDKSRIYEIARLRDFAIDKIKCNSFNFSTGEMIEIEAIDKNLIWKISEKAYKYSDKFYYAKLDASPREPHFFDYFLKELCKIPEFGDMTHEVIFLGKLYSVKNEFESSHIEQMETISEKHEEETISLEEKHEEETISLEEKHSEEIELIEQRHVVEIEKFEKFQEWIEERSYSSAQLESLKSIFELREKGLLEISELTRIFHKILNLKFEN